MNSKEGEHPSWYYTPIGIASLTVFVLGPLVLPLVWRSSVLSPRGRVIATVLIFAYTAIVVWQIWVAVQLALTELGR